jgi:protein-tyrosine phosphatase
MRVVELPNTIPGRLYVHGMPGRYELLEEFLNEIARNKISCVVCLVSPDEIRQKSAAYAVLLAGAVPWEHLAFPISHSGALIEHAPTLLEKIVYRLRSGRNVLIHCDSGVGRAGAVAVAVLLNIWTSGQKAERLALTQSNGP